MFGESRIPAPATFSYQVPGGNSYYNPSAQATLPATSAPSTTTPASGSTNLNWQPQTGVPGAATIPANSASFANQLPSQPVYAPPPGYPSNYQTLASSTATVQNTDFRSTSVNEANDPSRMVASDATGLQVPGRFTPPANWQSANRGFITVQGQYQYNAQPQFFNPNAGNSVLAQGSTASFPGQVQPTGSWQTAGQNNTNPGRR